MRHRSAFTSFAIATLLTGCAAATDPTRFYTLKSTSQSVASNPAIASKSVYINSITIPRLLDRPQIISRQGEHEIHRAEFHQWAGSFSDEISFVLRSGLENALQDTYFELLPEQSHSSAHFGINLDIVRLDGELGKNVVLDLRWHLSKEEEPRMERRGSIRKERLLQSPDYTHYVSAIHSVLNEVGLSLKEELLINSGE